MMIYFKGKNTIQTYRTPVRTIILKSRRLGPVVTLPVGGRPKYPQTWGYFPSVNKITSFNDCVLYLV